MSVFCEFHKAWRARFPGHELPAAWEEDVRANLTKHRSRVALLKEELEKEQFYVEYLERLLEDVHRHNNGQVDDLENKNEERGQCEGSEEVASPNTSIQSHGVFESNPEDDSLVTQALDSAMLMKSKDTNGFDSDKIKAKEPLASPPSDEGSNSGGTNSVKDLARRFSPGMGRPISFNRSTSVPTTTNSTLSPRTSTPGSPFLDESHFITVISVNGEDVSKNKKVPPTPPPKTFRRPSSTGTDPRPELSPPDISSRPFQPAPRGMRPKGPQLPTKPHIQKSASYGLSPSDNKLSIKDIDDKIIKNANLTKSPSDASSNDSVGKRSISKSSSSASSIGLPLSRRPATSKSSSMTSSRTDEEETDDILGHSSGNSLENLTDDEPLYDTVAPDEEDPGEYVVLSDKNSEYNGTDTLKSGASGASSEGGVRGSGGGSSSTPSGSPAPDYALESPKHSNYVNIDFFLKKKKGRSRPIQRNDSIEESDEEPPRLLNSLSSDHEEGEESVDIDSGVYGSSVESTSHIPSAPPTPLPHNKRWTATSSSSELETASPAAEAERLTMYKCIISSIIESETIYLECLDVMLQYMKALKATLNHSQSVISPDDFSTVFYRIPELHAAHSAFLTGLKTRAAQLDGRKTIGDLFRMLAGKLEVYAQFLQNYPRAVDTVRRCSNHSSLFAEITKSIKLRSLQSQAQSLEDLLHRPVARVQKNALVLHDLLKYTPDGHPDHDTLKEALRLTQNFLSHLSLIHTEAMFPAQNRPTRQLVRNSFIVELVDGQRKLRHLFLFNDVIVCAKYKATGRAEKFTYEVKWYISLHDIQVINEGLTDVYKENNPPNLVHLKSQASTIRDQLRRNEKTQETKGSSRLNQARCDKHRKKLSELEAQLILASPNLPFRVSKRNSMVYTFLLTSEYERDQWGEAINVLQANTPGVGGSSLTLQELQSWITSYRSFLKTNMGTFLLKSGRDNSLLLGDLHIVVSSLYGLTSPANVHICFEVDSYGHFFRKAKTKTIEGIEPRWNQDMIIELEGSQMLRVLCYEDHPSQGLQLRGKAHIELSKNWLNSSLTERRVSLHDLVLIISLKFLPPEATLRGVPSGKTSGLFTASIASVCSREKRSVPFIITRCVREVERRGVMEIGIYRVSGLASDITRLKKSFESNAYEAEQLVKEVDIHSVTGLLKLYLRELPEALFTDDLYPRFFEAFSASDQTYRRTTLLKLFSSLPLINQSIIIYLLEHLVKVNQYENQNKMSLHNLATVFGPTLLRPGAKAGNPTLAEQLAAGTVDVMAQAGILHFFLKRRANGEPIQGVQN